MGEVDPATTGPADVTSTYGAARELLQQAAHEARQTRGDAERYARLRQREADMLVAKARRLLMAAEEKAAVIIATARQQVADGSVDMLDLTGEDEIGRFIAPSAGRLRRDGQPTRLDRMLASAIAHAVDEAFPTEASA